MRNQDIGAAQAYHEGTKLSYINLSNKPPLYKSYASLPVVPLPADYSLPEMSALDAVATRGQGRSTSLDLSALARLLHLSAGLIRKSATPLAGEVQYRAAPSAGALYPVEVYLVCGDIPGLEAGVYHFSPRDFALGQLRKGDYRDALSRISGDDKAIATAPATLVLTAIFWRSAWKYRSRGYRYCFWDCGTIVANLLATASASGLPAHVILGFVDDWVNHLLGLHDEREASLCLIPIGETNGRPSPSHSPDLKPLSVEPSDALGEEGDYPEIRQMHLASSLATEEEAGDWRGNTSSAALPSPLFTVSHPAHTGGWPRNAGAWSDDFKAWFHPAFRPRTHPSVPARLDTPAIRRRARLGLQQGGRWNPGRHLPHCQCRGRTPLRELLLLPGAPRVGVAEGKVNSGLRRATCVSSRLWEPMPVRWCSSWRTWSG